jgi:hypothetical protein
MTTYGNSFVVENKQKTKNLQACFSSQGPKFSSG